MRPWVSAVSALFFILELKSGKLLATFSCEYLEKMSLHFYNINEWVIFVIPFLGPCLRYRVEYQCAEGILKMFYVKGELFVKAFTN